jgi:hypothetical protein
MKIKDLIKHLETLDQEKELVIIATDPTGWDYGQIVDDTTIELDKVYPCEDNGLEDFLPEIDWSEDDVNGIKCYVIRMDC